MDYYLYKYKKYKKKYLDYKKEIRMQGGSQSNVLKKIIHPIKGPNEITVVLKPFLVYNGNQFANTYQTGIQKVDKIIEKRIAKDHTNIKRIVNFYYESVYYWFDSGLSEKDLLEKNLDIITSGYKFKDGFIYLKLKKSNNNGFNESDYEAIKICFDPYDFGPDAYMLQDIEIYQGPENIFHSKAVKYI